MKRIFKALFALAFLALSADSFAQPTVVGPGNAIMCNKSAFVTPSTIGTFGLVNGVTGQVINFCGWHVTSSVSTVNTFQFEYGTQGGPCGTPTVFSAPFSVTQTAPSSDHGSFAGSTVPQGQQLCVVTTAATALQIQVYYSQF